MELDVKSFIGERCVTAEDGESVYREIHDRLAADQPVSLDFSGVKVFASPFFNSAIGQLLKDLEASKLNELLTVEGLIADGRLVWERVVRNAKEYYGNPETRKTIDEILRQEAEAE